MGKIAASLDILMLKSFQLQEGLAPDPLVVPLDPRWALPPDPRYRLELCARHGPKPSP